MPRKKAETGTVTGAKLKTSARGKKGGITGSKHFDKPEVETPSSPVETTKNAVGKAAKAASKGVKAAASTVGAARDITQTVSNGARQVRKSMNGSSDLVTADARTTLDKAEKLATGYGLELIDVEKSMGGDPYEVDENLPEMTAKEANARKLKIQRQNNALDVRLERTKQKRKIATVATEEIRLVGDLVDYSTAGIETATKVVKNQIADTRYQTEQSRLEETEELLEQQVIRTQGTIALTQGVRDEWNLKLEKQERNNEKIRLEIENTEAKNDRKREEIESFIFDD